MTDMESTQLSQSVPTPATHTHRLIPVTGWPDDLRRFDLDLDGFGIIARIKQTGISGTAWVVCSEETSIHAFSSPERAAAYFLNQWQAKVEQYHLDNWL
jgi:hypothetical protein